MKCDKCKTRESSIHLTQNRNGVITEHHLCEPCAQEQGIGTNIKSYFGSLMGSGSLIGGSIFDPAGGIPAFGSVTEKNATCFTCGQTYEEFRRSGLFGCSHCYEAFADRLDPLMRRVQGSTRHVGRKACQTASQQEQNMLRAKLNDLKKSLHQAVEEEAYEKAANLRDEIRSLNSRLCDNETSNDEGGAGT